MSYVPKYVLKRMIQQDGLKKVEGGVQLTMVNVLMPIPLDQVPGEILEFLVIKIDGRELTKDEMSKMKIDLDGKLYTFNTLKEVLTIPVGAQVKFFLPTTEAKVGQEVKIEILVAAANVNIEFTRTVA
jgi:hypothetical protein